MVENVSNNYQQAKDFLDKIRLSEEYIKSKEAELDALRYKASGAGAIRYDKDKVQTSPQSFLEMVMDDIVELSAQIEEDRASMEELLSNAYQIIKRMSDPNQRAVLEWYYIDCVTMEEAADKMYYSRRTIYNLRDQALEEFGRVM